MEAKMNVQTNVKMNRKANKDGSLKKPLTVGRVCYLIFAYLVLIFIVVVSVFPILWVILSSFKSNAAILSSPFALPDTFNFDAYISVINQYSFGTYAINSVIISFGATACSLLFFSMAAYVIAKYNFPCKSLIYVLLTLTLLVPGHTKTQPIFSLIMNLNLYDLRILRMTSEALHSGVTCCQFAGSRYWVDGEEGKENGLPVIGRRTISSRASFCLKQGQTLRMEKLCTVYTSRDARWENEAFSVEKLEEEGMNALREAEALGYDHLFAESADAWKQLWQEIDIQIDSENEFDQLAIRFAQYHMNSFILKNDNRVGIGAKGLSGEGYKGHSFWDTEIFVFPYFLLTQPKAARTLLEYRYNTLAGARKKAAENGCEGAMYPWESAWKDDGEVTPLWGAADVVTGKPTKIWTGILELHITADIAFAVKQYFRATGDQDFLDRYGYEIVIDAARFWASRAEWKPEHDRYEYTDVIGPDEYKEHVDNNAYTNYMAAYNMRTALEMMAELEARGDSVYERLNGQLDFAASADKIRKVLDKLYLPRESADGILPQFDGYFDLTHIDLTKYKQASVVGTIANDYNIEQISRIQVGKQADVLVLFFLLEELFSPEVKKKNFFYYEERTLHDSSLSRSTHSVLAADLGLDDMAYTFFEGAARTDLGPVMTTSDAGIHAASMGGIWQCVVYGFGGVRIVGDRLRLEPHLPKGWQELRFPLCWKGQTFRATVRKDSVKLVTESGESVRPEACGMDVVLSC